MESESRGGSEASKALRVGTSLRKLPQAVGVALSPGGAAVAAWSAEEVRVWARESGAELLRVAAPAQRVAFDASGQGVAWVVPGRGVGLGALGEGAHRMVALRELNPAGRFAAALAPGRVAWITRRVLHLATLAGEGEVVWSRPLGRGLSASAAVGLSPDGAWVLVRDYLEVQVFHAADGAPAGSFALPAGTVAGLDLVSQAVCTWRYDYVARTSTLERWALPGGALLGAATLAGQLLTVGWSADGFALGVTEQPDGLRLARVDPAGGAAVCCALERQAPAGLAVAPGGAWGATVHPKEAEVRLWSLERREEIRLAEGLRGEVRRLVWSAGGAWLVAAGGCGGLLVIDAARGALCAAEAGWCDVEAPPGGGLLATTPQGALWTLGLPTLAPRSQVSAPGGGVRLRLLAGLWPEVLAAGCPAASPGAAPLRWHRAEDGAALREEAASFALASGFEVSADGAALALCEFGSVVVLDARTGALEARLGWAPGHEGAPLTGALAWSPDGAWVVGTRRGLLGVAVDGALEERPVLAEDVAVTALAFMPGGVLLLGDSAGCVSWLRWPELTLLRREQLHDGAVSALVAAPSGQRWASGGVDSVVVVGGVATG